MASHLLLLMLAALAADPAPLDGQESTRQADLAKLAAGKARQVQMTSKDDKQTKLHDQPLLRWSNPTAGSVYGEVYLWSHEGRPAAIASIYRWFHPYKDCTFEVVSTSQSPITAREGEGVLWQSEKLAIEFKPFDNAPPVDRTAPGRLNQLRRLARRFSAELVDNRGGETIKRELRLLNQPLYQYDSAASKIVDGALFALVEVTDPEAWIIIEAVEGKAGLKWQYALARMNADGCQVKLDGDLVARWEKIVDPWKYRQANYTLFGFDPATVSVESQ
jgi:hypothetical protein